MEKIKTPAKGRDPPGSINTLNKFDMNGGR